MSGKVRFLANLLYTSCKSDPAIVVCLLCSALTKLYSILFSTFWLLFIQSFLGTKITTQKDAQQIYTNVMMTSIVVGTCAIHIVGKFSDKCNPQIAMPLSFLARLVTIGLFMQIDDPSTSYCILTSCVMMLGTMMENMTVDCLLLRKADPKIRGVLYSTAVAIGYCGLFVYSLVGGLLFDSYGPYAPFVLIGALDLVVGSILAILGYCGVISNDLVTI